MSKKEYRLQMETENSFDETYENEILSPRQINENLWLIFRGLYRNSENNSRQGICEFFLSRVEVPASSSDYLTANRVVIVCRQGDLSPGGNQPEELFNATGIVYSRQCVVQSGEMFIFTGQTENPDVYTEEFSF